MFTIDGLTYIPINTSERTCDVVDCTYLPEDSNIVIPENVVYKGIEMTVKQVQDYTFYNNDIKAIKLPNIERIGESAFENCSSLTSITIPQSVKSIGNTAFAGCISFANVTIEECVDVNDMLELGGYIFSNCPLDGVYIGRKLSYSTNSNEGYSPFYRNTTLRSVEITDAETQIYDNEFYGCTNLQSLKIGNGVKTIGKRAFSGCSKLEYFSAGIKLESIGEEAFSDCTGLTKFYAYAVEPPMCGSQALDDINKWECELYVPAEKSDEYMSAEQWNGFFFIKEMDPVLVSKISLDKQSVEIAEGDTCQLNALISPENATNKSLVWSSSDEAVVTVDENGLLTAVSAGTATITVKSADGNAEATCDVTVTEITTGVENVIAEQEMSVYNVNGYFVGNSLDNLPIGVYIVRQGNTINKVVVR